MAKSNRGALRKLLRKIPPDWLDDPLCAATVHEAGHAVMRWRLGLAATALTASADGEGRCEGTVRNLPPSDQLALTLAGYAAEFPYGLPRRAFRAWHGAEGGDMHTARELLATYPYLRGARLKNGKMGFLRTDDALARIFKDVCEGLRRCEDLIETIAHYLEPDGRLSAREVAAFCREWARRDRLRQQRDGAA